VAIYTKITIRKRKGGGKREYLALLNTGAGLKPLPTGEQLSIPFIIVPPEVAREIGIPDHRKLPEVGEYRMVKDTYIVCLHAPNDDEIVCLECYIFVRPEENRILLSFEFLASADIIIDPRRRCWIYRPENKEVDDFFKAINFRDVPKRLLKYTPYHDYID